MCGNRRPRQPIIDEKIDSTVAISIGSTTLHERGRIALRRLLQLDDGLPVRLGCALHIRTRRGAGVGAARPNRGVATHRPAPLADRRYSSMILYRIAHRENQRPIVNIRMLRKSSTL